MRIISMADVHLFDLGDPEARAFIHLLRSEAGRADLIVLNGDIFDFLVGRQRAALQHYLEVIEEIEAAAQASKIVFLQGNHDFHLDGIFSPAIEIGESWHLSQDGKNYLWLHGDLLGPTWHYRALRNVLNSSAVKLATERLPSPLVWKLALLWSNTSRDSSPDTTRAHMRHLQSFADNYLDDQCDVLLTGHYHLEHCYMREDGRFWQGMPPWLGTRRYVLIDQGKMEIRTAEIPS